MPFEHEHESKDGHFVYSERDVRILGMLPPVSDDPCCAINIGHSSISGATFTYDKAGLLQFFASDVGKPVHYRDRGFIIGPVSEARGCEFDGLVVQLGNARIPLPTPVVEELCRAIDSFCQEAMKHDN